MTLVCACIWKNITDMTSHESYTQNQCKHFWKQVCTNPYTLLLCKSLSAKTSLWDKMLLFSEQCKLCVIWSHEQKYELCVWEKQANRSWGPLIRYKNEWPSLAWGSSAAPCNAARHTMASATLPPQRSSFVWTASGPDLPAFNPDDPLLTSSLLHTNLKTVTACAC